MQLTKFAPVAGLLALAVFFVFSFDAVGEVYFNDFTLDLGFQTMPTPIHLAFMSCAAIFGGLAAACILLALIKAADHGPWFERSCARWRDARDIVWVAACCVIALLLSLLIRGFLLEGTAVTDDEGAYQFAAELIASGRLSVDSPPLKLFHDRTFVINDGQMYAMYFVGWPTLMAPGVWLGIPGFMNAVYFAATIPALFAVARRLVGSSWAKLALIVYISSPILLLASSTQMSNTSAVFALTYALWFLMRASDDDRPRWAQAGCALFFALAFFIRPTAAIGTGAPIVVFWAVRNLRPSRFNAAVVLAFVVPALLSGALFLYVNKAQTGSITTTGYAREHAYAKENDFRFTNWREQESEEVRGATAHFRSDLDPTQLMAASSAAAFRLMFVAFGLPFLFVFLFWARGQSWVGLLWSMVAVHFLFNSTANAPGLDIFGPHRYVAVVMPLLLLVIVGARGASMWLAKHSKREAVRLLPALLVLVLVAINMRMVLPIRLGGMARMTSSISRPVDKAAEMGIENAVIFAVRPFAPPCDIPPTRHYVFWHPANDPDLENDVLWVNHIDVPSNRRLMKFFPGRTGYIQQWMRDCTVTFIPLDSAHPDRIAPGLIGGSGVGLPEELTPEERELLSKGAP